MPGKKARDRKVSSDTLSIAPEVKASLNEEGLVLLDTRRGLIYTSNRTGARIWEGVTEGRSPDSIAEKLSMEHGVPRAQVEQHTQSFLADLKRRGILVTRRRSAACA
jgi:hypothetical protein